MTILVGVETLLLVLLALLVIGLLRSHAEILRRLEQLSGDAPHVPAHHEPTVVPSHHVAEAFDIAGETLAGEPFKVAVAGARRRTLLAFLSSGCLTCGPLWDSLGNGTAEGLPGDARVVVVVRDAAEESPSRLRELAPDDVLVVMSSEAWDRYRVAGSPYFILVEPDGEVAGEGSASSWDQLVSLIRDAVGDAASTSALPGAGRRASEDGKARLARADAELDSAGIGPGHPSLYSAEHEPSELSGGPS